MRNFLAKMFGHDAERDRLPRAPRKARRALGLEALEGRMLCSVGNEFHVNSRTTNDQWDPEVACQPVQNGQCVAVWTDDWGSDTDIRAQIYDGNGNKVGGEILVPWTTQDEFEPSVAMDAQGNFVIVWTQSPNYDLPGGDIKAQRYFANGTRNGSVISIATDSRPEYSPSVGMDASGNFVVSWTLDWSSSDQDVRARMFNSSGMPLGSSFSVAVSGLTDEFDSQVARAPDGRFSIAYTNASPVSGGGTNLDVMLKRYSASGTLIGTHAIANSSEDEFAPDVAMDRNGNTIVVFEYMYYPYSSPTVSDHYIMARKVFSDGVMGSRMIVSEEDDFYHVYSNPTVAMDLSDGDFVVAYEEWERNPATGLRESHIIVREMSSTGAVKSTIDLGFNTAYAALSINDSDTYFLAYEAKNKPGDAGQGIFGRRGLLV